MRRCLTKVWRALFEPPVSARSNLGTGETAPHPGRGLGYPLRCRTSRRLLTLRLE